MFVGNITGTSQGRKGRKESGTVKTQAATYGSEFAVDDITN